MATKKEQEKARAKKDAEKHAKESSKKSTKDTKSYDYKKLGISDDVWNSLSNEERSSVKVINAGIAKVIDKNQPIPSMLDPKEVEKLWKEAESDPVIQKTYAEELTVAKDYLSKNLDLLSSDFHNLTEKQQQQYIDAKKTINETQAAAGTAYSGFRTQAQQKTDKEQESIVSSSRNALQGQLNTLESSYEQRFGSKALSELNLKGFGASIDPLIGGKYEGPAYGEVGYKSTGGIGGTQSQDILADKLTKQQDLIAERQQEIELENIKREEETKKALSKVKI